MGHTCTTTSVSLSSTLAASRLEVTKGGRDKVSWGEWERCECWKGGFLGSSSLQITPPCSWHSRGGGPLSVA